MRKGVVAGACMLVRCAEQDLTREENTCARIWHAKKSTENNQENKGHNNVKIESHR